MPASSTQLPPAGYKLAEVGEIPDDWGSVPLAELGKMFSGGTPRLSEARFWDGEIPWVSSKDMKVARLHDAIDHVTPAAIGNGTRLVKPGTLLMVVRGMSLVHTFAVAIVETPLAFNQDLKAFLPHADGNSEFLLRWLEANQSRVLQLATESTHGTKRIPTGDLLASHVPLPPPAERRAIAEALSDVDGLLGALDALIAKKRAIKQAAMQQLLTGKTRLPGFSGPWESLSLGELEKRGHIKLFRGKVISQRDINRNQGDYPIYSSSVHSNGLFGCYGDYMFDEELISWSVDGGGHFFYRPKHRFSVTNVCGYMRIRTSRVHCRFFAYQLQELHSHKFFDYTMKAHPSVIRGAYQVDLPGVLEQVAIATALSNMDAGIAALEASRDKTRAIKQGMMQQLLTGRVRLVQPTMSTPEVATP